MAAAVQPLDSALRPADGSATDRRSPLRRPSPIRIAAAAVAGVQRFARTSGIRTYAVAADRVTICIVTSGGFDDFIPIRGSVTPLTIVYLDAIGRAS